MYCIPFRDTQGGRITKAIVSALSANVPRKISELIKRAISSSGYQQIELLS